MNDRLAEECHGYDIDGNPLDSYFTSAAYEAARRGYETREGAESAQKLQPHPWNWYVWQMNDGRWHISLMTNRQR